METRGSGSSELHAAAEMRQGLIQPLKSVLENEARPSRYFAEKLARLRIASRCLRVRRGYHIRGEKLSKTTT